MSEAVPQLDITKISFPSDALTIGQMRRHFPEVFDSGRNDLDFDDIELYGLLSVERDLAIAAFEEASGRRTPAVMSGEETSMLVDLYVRYHIASGPHHAEELIRAFQQTAVDQVRTFGKDSRLR
jgi:hypothetical protein